MDHFKDGALAAPWVMAESQDYKPTVRTTLKRRPQRGHYDRETVHAILDAGIFCHVGYVADGAPVVMPTIYWREGERVYWHGARGGRAAMTAGGAQVCFTVALMDGLVLARSAFKHSVNYRSVMAFGTAHTVEDEAEKLAALKAMIERLYPGRWAQIRPPSKSEFNSVTVLYLDLKEVSAKIRSEPPLDDETDLAIPVWAGVAPFVTMVGQPEPCPKLKPGLAAPAFLDLPASVRGKS